MAPTLGCWVTHSNHAIEEDVQGNKAEEGMQMSEEEGTREVKIRST